ncbi:GDSL-type esterase/lipase family protein, partial [Candidatus Enterococcus willemsii]|uniref:GDSL-type esterase/lipase family protein n=1 Tax=Candidatus Enterococcus willemsii TaxID=1857215 RepID=UPI003075B571
KLCNRTVSGYEKLIEQAKKHESKIFLATISPFIGYTKDIKNEEKEELRQKVNAWIRKNTEVDGIYDFDQVLADPKDPTKLNSSYDSGDKLHPSEAGGAQMAKTIDVDAFKR